MPWRLRTTETGLNGSEPEVGHPLRKAYWDMRDRYETSLMREMYIGDQPDIMFQLDFPKAIRDWPGTFTLFGSSGAGKTYFLVAMIERYLRSVSSGEHPARDLAEPRGED